MTSPAPIDDLPDYASLGLPTERDGLEQFDHLQAYRRLGPIYQLGFRGERHVVIAGMEANEAAWRNPDQWSYHDALVPFREIMGPTHVTQLDREPHRRKRRNLRNGFAMSAVVRHLPVIDEVLREAYARHLDQPVRLHDFFMTALTQANSRTVLHCGLDAVALAHFIVFEEEFISGTILGEARHAHYARPAFVAHREFVFGFLRELVSRRLAGQRCPDSFQDMIDDRRERGEPLELEELVPEAYLLLMAGTGNTAKMLNCGLQHLLANPGWLGPLEEELAGYRIERLMGGMGAFPRLRATLMEMERMFPAAPVLSRVVEEPFEFHGHRLPRGTRVLHLQTLPHFLDEVYADPYRFDPSRWMDREYPKKAHGTFGGSTHICLGMNLVRLHTPVAVANLLRDHRVSLGGEPEILVNLNYGVPQAAHLTARWSRRDLTTGMAPPAPVAQS
ncbi:MAG: cytochrome P450 [Verrucomicrobiota bacterium]